MRQYQIYIFSINGSWILQLSSRGVHCCGYDPKFLPCKCIDRGKIFSQKSSSKLNKKGVDPKESAGYDPVSMALPQKGSYIKDVHEVRSNIT